MKRFRVKVVGLGLALAAGTWDPACVARWATAVAAEGDWRAPGQPATPATAGGPGLLPPALRAAGAKPDPAPIWLPAREPGAAPLIMRAGGPPEPSSSPPSAPAPRTQPEPGPPELSGSFGPRANAGSGPFPTIPVPEAPVLPDLPAIPLAPSVPEQTIAPAPRQPDPVPPKPAAVDPPMMVPPRAPEFLPPWKGDPIPAPRPVEVAPAVPASPPELHPAPPELMYPAGVLEVHKHRTFGSPPIRLSRDYPSLGDLVHHDLAGDDALANRVFVRGEYLLWWMPGFPVPVLGTTNPNPALNGFFGEPGTTTILGPGSLVGSTRSGFRLRAGAWLDEGHACGIDAGFFFLGSRSETAVRDSSLFPLITRPVFVPNVSPVTGAVVGESGEAVAVPGILRGTLTARGDSRLWGADVNLRKCLFTECDSRAEVFAGYRHLNLRESLTITENITVVGDGGDRLDLPDPVGTRVVVQDRFATRNYFHGGQLGAYYERRFGRWDVDARGSIGLGGTRQILDIDAFQVRQRPDGTVMSFRGGLLGAGPNLGRFERDKFSFVPEFTLNFGYRVTPNVRVFAGYNFLLWTNVIRPGDQIDRVVDLTFVPNAPMVPFSGQVRPRPLFAQRDLVVNGVQIGLDWRW